MANRKQPSPTDDFALLLNCPDIGAAFLFGKCLLCKVQHGALCVYSIYIYCSIRQVSRKGMTRGPDSGH